MEYSILNQLNNKNKRFKAINFYENLNIKEINDIIKCDFKTTGDVINKIKLNDNLFTAIIDGNLILRLQYINQKDMVVNKQIIKKFIEEINIPKYTFMKSNVNINLKVIDFFHKIVSTNRIYFSACLEIEFL